MIIESFEMKGPLLIKPNVYRDDRGYFLETYHQLQYQKYGVHALFVQDNHSYSTRGVIRGLHYQIDHAQDKLVFVNKGKIQDIILDLRKSSPTFGKHLAIELDHEKGHQLFIPKGFAHGFEALSDEVLLSYKCSDVYHAQAERSIDPLDKTLALPWKTTCPLLSTKDQQAPAWQDLTDQDLFD